MYMSDCVGRENCKYKNWIWFYFPSSAGEHKSSYQPIVPDPRPKDVVPFFKLPSQAGAIQFKWLKSFLFRTNQTKIEQQSIILY